MIFRAVIGEQFYFTLTAISARPVDTPASTGCRGPIQPLGRGASGIVIKRSGTFVEASGMPGIRKLEMLKVEMVAVFVAQRAEKGSKRSDVFLQRGPHPHPDGQGGRMVVAKKFTRPVLANAE